MYLHLEREHEISGALNNVTVLSKRTRNLTLRGIK